MKRMWSEEEVNAAIAEYAATHPAGGKLYLHKVSFESTMDPGTYGEIQFFSTSNKQVTRFSQIPNGRWNSWAKINDSGDVYDAFQIQISHEPGQPIMSCVAMQNGSAQWITNYGDPGDISITADTVSEL